MRSKVPENPLVALLRQYYSTPSCLRSSKLGALSSVTQKRSLHISNARHATCQSLSRRTLADHSNSSALQESNGNHSRAYATATTNAQASNEIAVLGGGITGLATAFYLTKELPDSKITIYEGGSHLGGWLRTKHIDVGTGTILFEGGPRSLRPSTPAGLLTLQMVRQLGLEDEIIATSPASIAAKNRYLYYPDRLVAIPGRSKGILRNLWTIFTEPAFEGTFGGVVGEYKRPKRPEDLEDESIASFFRRRLGTSKLGDNVASAGIHGVYAGDIEQLSIKSLMTFLWDYELRYGSVAAGLFASMKEGGPKMLDRDAKLMQEVARSDFDQDIQFSTRSVASLQRRFEIGTSVHYSFKRGLGSLSEALVDYLKKTGQVEIKTSYKINRLEYHEGSKSILVKGNKKATPPKAFSRVVSTISGRKLSSLVPAKNNSISLIPSLASIHSVTVMVVNLFFANPNVLPAHGFGYLIPRAIDFDQNPECALGVVFDSDAMVGQDTAPGTKVTVMLGGHWWDGAASYPTEDEGAAMAKAVLKRHLGINEEPAKILTSLQKDCIPQYTVGHEGRMKKAHDDLMKNFGGRLAVAGNSYTGVGVNDCVRGARDLAIRIKDSIVLGDRLATTGLEIFRQDRKYVSMKPTPRLELRK